MSVQAGFGAVVFFGQRPHIRCRSFEESILITHIVLFKLKDLTDTSRQEVVTQLESMDGKIPQLRYLQVGVDVVHSDRSYDVALITKFESLADLSAYQVNAYHVEEVVPLIRRLCSASVTVDFAE